MAARFDLIYVVDDGARTMCVAIFVDSDSRLVGPFPAKEARPKIVDALLAEPALGFASHADAAARYMFAHAHNMSRMANDAGQSYPYRVALRPDEERQPDGSAP